MEQGVRRTVATLENQLKLKVIIQTLSESIKTSDNNSLTEIQLCFFGKKKINSKKQLFPIYFFNLSLETRVCGEQRR